MSNKDFYRAFEERYYAPRKVIKSLRKQYLPYVEKLMEIYPTGQTFDLGCGRGEWLELMSELGLNPYGVDLDDGMLQGCKDLGVAAEKGDAVQYLQTLKSDSQLVISAFHVVEHISFEDLQIVVQEALRVLKPGGLLILETPNPENLKVATENFYLDPTHIKPIPSALLSFLPEFYGYARTKVLRLQESQELFNSEFANLSQVINGTSPDYTVIAQKQASSSIMSSFNSLFEKEYGLSLNTLLTKFDNRLNEIELKTAHSEAIAREAKAQAYNAWKQYHTIVNSNSWKITKPLRTIGKGVRWFIHIAYQWLTFSPKSKPKRILKNIRHYKSFRFTLKDRIASKNFD